MNVTATFIYTETEIVYFSLYCEVKCPFLRLFYVLIILIIWNDRSICKDRNPKKGS